MASITVTPTTVAVGAPTVVAYAGGTRIRFLGPQKIIVDRTAASGSFEHILEKAGTYTVEVRNKGRAVATTKLEVRPVIVEPVPPEPPTPPPGLVGRAGRGRLEDWAGNNPRVISDGKSYTSTLKIDGGVYTEPGLKVIAGARFSGNSHGLTLANGSDLLFWDCTFEGLRTHQPGRGCHGINGSGTGLRIWVIGSFFGEVSADGIQNGGSSSNDTLDWRIAYNDFIGPGRVEWGENGLDWKGTRGGHEVDHNVFEGWYPCQSAKTTPGGNQDCSGSQGEGVVFHSGVSTGKVRGIRFHDNVIRDCPGIGLVVSECEDMDIGPNTYVGTGLRVHSGTGQYSGAANVRVSRKQQGAKLDIRVPVAWYP